MYWDVMGVVPLKRNSKRAIRKGKGKRKKGKGEGKKEKEKSKQEKGTINN